MTSLTPKAAANLKTKKNRSRLPALATTHGYDLNWEHFLWQAREFDAWMTLPFNPERDGPCYELCNLDKVKFVVESVLTHLAIHHNWGNNVTFSWLLYADHFDAVYTTYAEYLHHTRQNSLSYIAKQLGDLRHAILWTACHEQQMGYEDHANMAVILTKLAALRRQYTAEGTKATKRRREIVDDQPPSDIPLKSFRDEVVKLEANLLARVGDHVFEDFTDEERLEVAECLMLKMSCRGGRGVDLQRICLADEADAESWISSEEIGEHGALLVASADGVDKYELLLLDTKGHVVRASLDDVSVLLNVFFLCFQGMVQWGDYLFTPCQHGSRLSKSHVQEWFQTSGAFGDYFDLVTKRELGYGFRPYAVRRMNAESLQTMNATPEVKLSHSALMGTGVAKLEGPYDRRSAKAKGFLASQVQRHQFDVVLSERLQTRMILALVPGQGVLTVVARMVRENMLAVFEESDGYLELGSVCIQTDIAGDLPEAQLALEPHTARQVLRAPIATHQQASEFFASRGLGDSFAVQSMVHGNVQLRPRDMVYVGKRLAIAEVQRLGDDGVVTVMLATELLDVPNRSTMQAFFRFTESSDVIEIKPEDVHFPIDLSFNAVAGFFVFRKSKHLRCI